LETTLRLYRDERAAVKQIPTLRMLTLPLIVIQGRASELKTRLDRLSDKGIQTILLEDSSKAGGGSLPMLELPTCCVGATLQGLSANALEKWMRKHTPPIIGRIENDRFIMDPRTLQDEELDLIEQAFRTLAAQSSEEK
jgi:L-seryl-tRNA(Ser) seleniumtransferase